MVKMIDYQVFAENSEENAIRQRAIDYAKNIINQLQQASVAMHEAEQDQNKKYCLKSMSDGFTILSEIVNKLIDENNLLIQWFRYEMPLQKREQEQSSKDH